MQFILKYSGIYLVAIFCFAWGVASVAFHVFPYSYLKLVEDFVRGDTSENLSVIQMLGNDFGGKPRRLIRTYVPADQAGFEAVILQDTRSRRDAPRVRIDAAAPDSYRLMVGAFDFEQAFWGAILMNPAGHVLHRWYMNGEIPELTEEPDTLKNLYGVAFFPDGSAAFSMQERSGGFIKMDYCSKVQWTKAGNYHHVAQPTEDMRAFWTFGGEQHELHPVLILIDAETGETLREIDMADVEQANPEIPIFNLQRVNYAKSPTHPNHIEPLPSNLDAAYPQFSAGDLVLSYHTTNLIFVIDPDSLQIKWWYVGAGDGQHDPDWHADGTISIFNNRIRSKWRGLPEFSTIVKIDPATHSHETILDGANYNFYSSINGHHYFTKDDTVIITSAMQGRIFEVDLTTGRTVFDYVNSYNSEDEQTLHVSETFIIDAGTVDRWQQTDCSDTNPNQRD